MKVRWLVQSNAICIRGNIRGNILAVMLVIAWRCAMNVIGCYIGLEFRCQGYMKASLLMCEYFEILDDAITRT